MDFEKIRRLLSPYILHEIFRINRRSNQKLTDRLDEINFITRSFNDTPTSTTIELQILDVDKFYLLLCGEAFNFWLAATITLDRARQNHKNNAAWQAIEQYYAAYFSIHYLIRTTGSTLTNIDSKSAKIIERSAIPSLTNNIPIGLYICTYSKTHETLTLTKEKKSSGGSHKEAWKLWDELIDKMLAEANNDIAEYSDTAINLIAHRKFIRKSTGHYTPPEIRAEINYQFKGQLWSFEKCPERPINQAHQKIMSPIICPNENSTPPNALIENNKIIIELANHIHSMGAKINPKSICNQLIHKYKSSVKIK